MIWLGAILGQGPNHSACLKDTFRHDEACKLYTVEGIQYHA